MAGVLRIAALSSLLFSACFCADSLSFLVVGDWGGQSDPPYYTEAEKEVAGCMAETAANIGSQFTMALGDNFYPDGVKDVDDPRFNETFEVGDCNVITMHSFIRSSSPIVSSPPHGRMCSLLSHCSLAGTLYVVTMTTMVTQRQRWPTPTTLRDGTCQTTTTLR